MNSIFIINTLIIVGIIAAAIMVVVFEKHFPALIALALIALLMAIEFIVLQAPDVAIFEVITGVILIPVFLLITLKRVRRGK